MKWLGISTIIICMNLSHAQNLDVYVSAHPDDWQLFMNPNAFESLQKDDTKVMFLHTTAGDAGQGMNNNYTLAREEGSFRAIRFLVNAKNGRTDSRLEIQQQPLEINGHKIRRFDYDNAIVIFMRLPDGNYYGPGYDTTGNSSLFKFYTEQIPSFTTVDSSATYSSKKDLVVTLTKLLKQEVADSGEIQINIADTDSIINPGDHSDHRFTSYFMQNVARNLNLKSVRLYTEYETSNKPMNVKDDLFLISAGCWGATASGLSDEGHYSTWDSVHNAWIGRQYFREEEVKNLPKYKYD